MDWAQEIKDLLDTDYREAETVVLVCDNLNTHTPAALYKAFSPEEARRLVPSVIDVPTRPNSRELAQHRPNRTQRLDQLQCLKPNDNPVAQAYQKGLFNRRSLQLPSGSRISVQSMSD